MRLAMSENIKKLIKENSVEFVDLRFTDLRGKEQHVTLPVNKVDDNFFKYGKAFDGSSIAGWQGIDKSDLVLLPDSSTGIMDLFTEIPTAIVRCDVVDPEEFKPYVRDPRAVTRRAEAFVKKSGIADVCYFGQEVEFFIFDNVL